MSHLTALKRKISQILMSIRTDYAPYRRDDGSIRWGLVERDLHDAVDEVEEEDDAD